MDFSLIKKDPAEAKRLMFAAVQRARELPGVRAAALGTMLPYGNFTNTRRVMSAREAMPTDPKAADPGAGALYTSISPGYFDAIGVRLLRGRDFTSAEAENREGPRVAIIDDEMAKKLFPNAEALGQHLRYTQPPKDGSPNDIEIVGIVNQHRHDVQNDTLNRRVFVPFAHSYNGNVFLHTRLNTMDRNTLVGMIPTLRQTFRNIDPDLPILTIEPFSDLKEKSVGLWIVRLGAILFGVFGGIGAPPRRGRRLWGEGLRGRSANPRNRDSHGARRASRRCLRSDHETGRAPARAWLSCFGVVAVVRRRSHPRPDSLRSQPERSLRPGRLQHREMATAWLSSPVFCPPAAPPG